LTLNRAKGCFCETKPNTGLGSAFQKTERCRCCIAYRPTKFLLRRVVLLISEHPLFGAAAAVLTSAYGSPNIPAHLITVTGL